MAYNRKQSKVRIIQGCYYLVCNRDIMYQPDQKGGTPTNQKLSSVRVSIRVRFKTSEGPALLANRNIETSLLRREVNY